MPESKIAGTARDTPGPTYACSVQVRWSDFDQLGHVNNAAYLSYAEQCRVQYLRDRWIRAGQPAPATVVRRMEVDYFKPILPETEEIRVELTVQSIGRTSFSLRHTLVDQHGVVNCVIDCIMVVFDTITLKPQELTSGDRLMLTGYPIKSDSPVGL